MNSETNENMSALGQELKEEAFSLRSLLGLEDDFFERGTLDDRMAFYSAVLHSPQISEEGAEMRFARLAPQYELYRYAWSVIRNRFDADAIRGREDDIEMTFLEAILRNLETYDPAEGAAGAYFGVKIHGAVYEYLNSVTGSRNPRDSRVLKHISSIRERLLAAGFREISEGDLALELDNTGIAANRLSRERLRYLLNVPEEREIPHEEMPDLAETLSDDGDSECFRDPSRIVYQTDLRQSIMNCIFRHAADEREAMAYIAVFYSDGCPLSLPRAAMQYYGGSISRKELAGRLEKLSARLRDDIEFMELLGTEE